MKTILCPVDFTPASDHLLHFAAHLAEDTKSKIVLFATEPQLVEANRGSRLSEKEELHRKLDAVQNHFTHDHAIHCESRDEVVSPDDPKTICHLAKQYDLLCLSVPSVQDTPGSYGAGLNLVRILQRCRTPLLLVPEKASYNKINRLLYAYDCLQSKTPPLHALGKLAEWFEAELRLLSVLQNHKQEERMSSVYNQLANEWHSRQRLSFDSIVYDDVAQSLSHYLSLFRHHDLLVLSVNHRSMLNKIGHRSVILQMLKSNNHPQLILHREVQSPMSKV